MIKLRHQQPSLWHRGLAEDIEGLWEPWMRLVDELLEDERLVDTVYEARGERHAQSRVRGRMQTPAEVLLRLLLLKARIRNWTTTCWSERCEPIWYIAPLPGSETNYSEDLDTTGRLIEPKVIDNCTAGWWNWRRSEE